jgi:small subunit ribosomal protein S9
MNNLECIAKGLGRRKTAIAHVQLTQGTGSININNKKYEDFFASRMLEKSFLSFPFFILNVQSNYDAYISVKGGGVTGQLEAIKLGISRALLKITPQFRSILKEQGLLKRDARIKERRKYGLKKARKASQYSKR